MEGNLNLNLIYISEILKTQNFKCFFRNVSRKFKKVIIRKLDLNNGNKAPWYTNEPIMTSNTPPLGGGNIIP